ncbi:MAG: hypothetical protein ABUK20_12655 [Anaerolineales bacterium]
MDLFLQDPNEIPLPPDEVRIRELRIDPLPDNRRIRISLQITPFQTRPNIEIFITNENEEESGSLTIIESIDPKMEFTVHLKDVEPSGKYTASAQIYYYEDDQNIAAKASQQEEGIHQLPTNVKIVDHHQATFVIENHPAGE